jgi:hypothetical protein
VLRSRSTSWSSSHRRSGAIPQESCCSFQLVGEERSIGQIAAGRKPLLSPLTDELRYPNTPHASHLTQPIHGVLGKAHRVGHHRLANVDCHGLAALPLNEEALVVVLFVVLRETLDRGGPELRAGGQSR